MRRTALAVADAVIATGGAIDDDLRGRALAHLGRERSIEVVLDVVKWCFQKVPVTLGTDREVRPGALATLRFDDAGAPVISVE